MDENNRNSFEYTYSAPQQEEIKRIKEKYMPKEKTLTKLEQVRLLDKRPEQAGTAAALALGIVGTLMLGLGMSYTMVMTDYFALGIVIGVVGLVVLAIAYPVYVRIVAKERKKIAPEILKLIEEIE